MSEKVLGIGVIGAGRIGKIHAANVASRVRGARLAGIADVSLPAARELAARWQAPRAAADYRELLDDPSVEAVAVASATDTHLEIVKEAARRGKHVFCEKPLGIEPRAIEEAIAAVAAAGVKLQVGFNRRFDPTFARVRSLAKEGKVGKVHVVRVTSRDPAPPPLEYVRSSGGIFLDMTIHDFDMVRFLSGSEAVEVHAVGDALVDPAVRALGDVDTCVVTMRLESGALATIDNSRKAVYGYDQRVEVFGSGGMACGSNRAPDGHALWTADGPREARPYDFFLDRYEEAYVAEMQAFVDCVLHDTAPPVTGFDGLAPVLMARAAKESLESGKVVRLDPRVRQG